jgi:hypothetical protein
LCSVVNGHEIFVSEAGFTAFVAYRVPLQKTKKTSNESKMSENYDFTNINGDDGPRIHNFGSNGGFVEGKAYF